MSLVAEVLTKASLVAEVQIAAGLHTLTMDVLIVGKNTNKGRN